MPPTSSTRREDDLSPKEKNSAVCPVVEGLDAIGSKWRLVLIYELADGEQRFNELKRSTGASSRTLSRVLDDLQEAGLVDRRVEDDPIASYYSLTARGEALEPVFSEFEAWATEWLLDGEGPESGSATAE